MMSLVFQSPSFDQAEAGTSPKIKPLLGFFSSLLLLTIFREILYKSPAHKSSSPDLEIQRETGTYYNSHLASI